MPRLKRGESVAHILKCAAYFAYVGARIFNAARKCGILSEMCGVLDSNPSQPSASTPVVAEIHKEDPQATGGPTSLGVTSEGGADPQLSSGNDPHVLVEKTKSASEGLETVLTQPTTGKGASDFAKKDRKRSQKRKLELEKNKAEAEAVFLTALPSYLNGELPAEFLSIPTLVESVQAKTKTLDALSSLLNKVTEALNKFTQVFASALQNTRDTSVHSACQAGTQPAEGRRT
ncbi:reverse transcriptase domain-containing protein [Tanacetum coccineum]